jgi:hypothetical protein
MNKNQFEIDDKTRLKLILSHISTHQGCIKADLENAFDGKISSNLQSQAGPPHQTFKQLTR